MSKFPCFWINPSTQADQSNLHFFFMKSHPLDQEFLSFKNPKLASYSGEKDTEAAISFGYLLLSYFGVFSCHEIQLSYYFPDHFQKIFLKKWWVDSSFIHISISSLFGFGSKPNFFLDSKNSWDRVWCGLQVCSRRRRWEVESGKY